MYYFTFVLKAQQKVQKTHGSESVCLTQAQVLEWSSGTVELLLQIWLGFSESMGKSMWTPVVGDLP